MSAGAQLAGDVNIDSVKITTAKGVCQDITNQVIGIQIFEDIFAPFITGSLVVKDSLDLVNLFPFIGEEFLELKVSTPSLNVGNFDNRFIVTKMTNREMVGDRATVYELHFISTQSIIDINKKISKTFTGKCSDIAKICITDPLLGLQVTNPYQIEETSNGMTFTSNFWSPVKTLNYLTNNAVNKNNSPTYVFYENRNGFNFISLESLYIVEVYQEFRYDNFTRNIFANGNSSRDIAQEYKRIKKIKIPVGFDYVDRTRKGMYGSKLYTYDITSKNFKGSTFNMLDDFASSKHLNKNPLASSKAVYKYGSTILTIPKYTENFSGTGDVTNTKIIQKRVSLMTQINASKLEILVPGRCDYTAGMKVLLDLYKVEPIKYNDTDVEDKMFSGNYIVAAINHIISRDSHECNMELVKESLIMNLDR